METVDVAIVGGGVAGAAAACAFGGAGLDVVMLERRRLVRDANRGDALHASAVAQLERWGALPALERRGAFPMRHAAFTAPGGRPTVQVALDRAPFLMLAHAEIEDGLAEAAAARGVAVRACGVHGLERDGDAWRMETAPGPLRARLVVGADGARSLVRGAAGIAATRTEYGQATVVLHAPRPAWLEADCGWALVHPDGGVLILPTTPAGTCRVVALVRREELDGWRSAPAEELRRRLAARSPRLRDLLVERRDGSHVYLLASQHAMRYADGAVALVGDAAHVVHPNGGQGMALAIHDAAALAELAVPALRRRHGLGPALAAYELRRRPANARALARADRAARLASPGRVAYSVALAGLALGSLAPWAVARVYQRFGTE